MTIYFDKRAFEQQEEEENQELEEQKKKEEAAYALGKFIGFFAKPLVLMLLWN